MARVDIRPFVLGWLKDVRGATAPDGGWRTLDEVRAGLQRQGIQASAPECRKVLAALTDEHVIALRKACPGQMAAWRFVTHEEHETRIEEEAALLLLEDWNARLGADTATLLAKGSTAAIGAVDPGDYQIHLAVGEHGRVSVTLKFLDMLVRHELTGRLDACIEKARASARGLVTPKAPDAFERVRASLDDVAP